VRDGKIATVGLSARGVEAKRLDRGDRADRLFLVAETALWKKPAFQLFGLKAGSRQLSGNRIERKLTKRKSGDPWRRAADCVNDARESSLRDIADRPGSDDEIGAGERGGGLVADRPFFEIGDDGLIVQTDRLRIAGRLRRDIDAGKRRFDLPVGAGEKSRVIEDRFGDGIEFQVGRAIARDEIGEFEIISEKRGVDAIRTADVDDFDAVLADRVDDFAKNWLRLGRDPVVERTQYPVISARIRLVVDTVEIRFRFVGDVKCFVNWLHCVGRSILHGDDAGFGIYIGD